LGELATIIVAEGGGIFVGIDDGGEASGDVDGDVVIVAGGIASIAVVVAGGGGSGGINVGAHKTGRSISP